MGLSLLGILRAGASFSGQGREAPALCGHQHGAPPVPNPQHPPGKAAEPGRHHAVP